tara:strand:- start:124 stop:690 length:567 start_codon:yes stop_codon:yes gene_type:complete
MDTLIEWDKTLFLWLNTRGTPTFDSFWMMMTNRASNILIYLILWLFISWKTTWKKGLYLLLFTALLILLTDQLTNLFKLNFGRLRPCYDQEIKSLIRLVKSNCGGRFSFFSGHASNSFALAIFFGGILKSYIRYSNYGLLFIASLIAYSRVYIGVHFPLDIICGAIAGVSIGKLFHKSWNRFVFRILS